MHSIRIIAKDEREVQKIIEQGTKGFRVFFYEPEGADYQFINPFFGREWNRTAESMKDIIIKGASIGGKIKRFIMAIQLDGRDRFAFCSWSKEIYDFDTKQYYKLIPPHLALKITQTINAVL